MRKKLTAVVLAVLVFSLIAASAASLGQITTNDVGASAVVVGSCDTNGVDVDFTSAWDSTNDDYYISRVDITGIADACLDGGSQLSMTLSNTAGSVEFSVGPRAIADNGTVDDDGVVFGAAAMAGGISATDVESVSIVIG